MMRILLISGSYPPEHCGVGDYTAKLAASLAMNTGFKVGVLTTEKADPAGEGGVEILRVARSWLISEFPAVLQAIRAWRPDVVHIQYPSQGFHKKPMSNILPYACSMYGIYVIQTWHEPYRWHKVVSFLLQAFGTNGLIFVRPNYLEFLPMFLNAIIRKYHKIFIPNASVLSVSSLDSNEKINLRYHLLHERQRLVMFFGFVYPYKGVESIFDIANPSTDELIIIGAIPDDAYRDQLIELAKTKGWSSHVRFTGFLSTNKAADLLAVADAVILPFAKGSGEWNTSLHGALAQGTLVIATSMSAHGDDPEKNLYLAHPTAIDDMRTALNKLAGRRTLPIAPEEQWKIIADTHCAFYRKCKNVI